MLKGNKTYFGCLFPSISIVSSFCLAHSWGTQFFNVAPMGFRFPVMVAANVTISFVHRSQFFLPAIKHERVHPFSKPASTIFVQSLNPEFVCYELKASQAVFLSSWLPSAYLFQWEYPKIVLFQCFSGFLLRIRGSAQTSCCARSNQPPIFKSFASITPVIVATSTNGTAPS